MFDRTQKIYKRPDGTFVITYNGLPFHATPEDLRAPKGLWEQVLRYATENPESVLPESVPLPPTQEQLNAIRHAQIISEMDAIDRRLVRPMAAIVDGTATDEDRKIFYELIAEKDKLRNEKITINMLQ